MQEVVKVENERMKDMIFLLQKVYGNRILIKEMEYDQVEIQLDGELNVYPYREETFFSFLKQYFQLKRLDTKKEIYDRLSKLSEIYLSCMNHKRKRELLKEIVPSLEKVVSSFFDVSKYCSDEHIFDDFYMKNMTYDRLLLLFPRVLSNLKGKRKEEKKYELQFLFQDCQNISQAFGRVQELIKNQKAYQEALEEIYPDYQDFFTFFETSYKEITPTTHLEVYDYQSLYQLLLNKTIELKQEEIQKENIEYQQLLNRYQELKKQIRILEVQPQFAEIKKRDSELKEELKIIEEEETSLQMKIREKEMETSKVETEKQELLTKHIWKRVLQKKKLKAIELQLQEFFVEQETFLKNQNVLKMHHHQLMAELNENESSLSVFCEFPISILEYEEKRNQYLETGSSLEEWKEECFHLEESLMTYHIEKKEWELKQICRRHHVLFPHISFFETKRM